MGIQIGIAVFDDAETKFFIFDNIINEAFCLLFSEENTALDACRSGEHISTIPPTVSHDQSESVTLFFYINESGKGICARSHTNTNRTHITSYRSLEQYQNGSST